MDQEVNENNKTDVNWPAVVLSEQFFSRLSRIAERSIVDPVAAEQAATFVLERLSENEWERCKKYTGKSSPSTFVYSLASNLVIDYSRMLYGRHDRPPTWVVKKGLTPVWKFLCLERRPVEAVIDKLCETGQKSRETVKTMITAIRAKFPWCGFSARPESLDDDSSDLLERNALEQDGENDALDQAEVEETMQFAHLMLEQHQEDYDGELAPSERIADAFGAIDLAPNEMLILRLLFVKGMTNAAAARELNLPKRDFDRLKKQIFEKARTQLISIGIEYREA